MQKTLILIAAAFVAALAVPALASAGMRAGSVEVGPFLSIANFDKDGNIKDDQGIGGRLGFVFEPHHELEISLDQVETNTEDDDFGFHSDVDLTTLKLGYVYNFVPEGTFSPLITAGVGGQRIQVSEEPIFGGEEFLDETDPLVYGGVGVRLFFGSVFNVRVDGQAVAVFPNSDTDDTLVDGLINAGVGWVFGGR